MSITTKSTMVSPPWPHALPSQLTVSENPDLGFNLYPAQKKSKVNKWIKIGVPVLILVIIIAVLAGIFGSRAAQKKNSQNAAESAASSEANAQSSIRAALGRFATATDDYFLPVYPSTVCAHLETMLHCASHPGPFWQRGAGPVQDACRVDKYKIRP